MGRQKDAAAAPEVLGGLTESVADSLTRLLRAAQPIGLLVRATEQSLQQCSTLIVILVCLLGRGGGEQSLYVSPSLRRNNARVLAPVAVTAMADLYIDSAATDAATELQKLGGARVVLATAPSGKAMSSLVGGLGANGKCSLIPSSQIGPRNELAAADPRR